MQDLTQYGDGELSSHFLNDESLYNVLRTAARRNDFSLLEMEAREFFTFTSDQLADLKETFEAEIEEEDEEEEEAKDVYMYVIDLDERGIFRAHVEEVDKAGNVNKTVFDFNNEEEENGELWLIRDGWMKHATDLKGLKDYLKEQFIMFDEDELITEAEQIHRDNVQRANENLKKC